MQGHFGYWAVKLAAICAALFILDMLMPVNSSLMLVSSQILSRPWTLVTHIFIHSGWLHLIYNMSALLLFGSLLENEMGWRRFVALFLASGIAAGIGGSLFYISMLGASGAIFGAMGCLAMLRPKMVVWTYGAPMYMIAAAMVWAAFDFMLFNAADGVAHASHLIGMGFGAVIGLELRARMPKQEKAERHEDVVSEEELDEWERGYMGRSD